MEHLLRFRHIFHEIILVRVPQIDNLKFGTADKHLFHACDIIGCQTTQVGFLQIGTLEKHTCGILKEIIRIGPLEGYLLQGVVKNSNITHVIIIPHSEVNLAGLITRAWSIRNTHRPFSRF